MVEKIENFLKEFSFKNDIEKIEKQAQKDFFILLYKVLLGKERGPRLGQFIKMVGISKTIELLDASIR